MPSRYEIRLNLCVIGKFGRYTNDDWNYVAQYFNMMNKLSNKFKINT